MTAACSVAVKWYVHVDTSIVCAWRNPYLSFWSSTHVVQQGVTRKTTQQYGADVVSNKIRTESVRGSLGVFGMPF